ncbi:hypothetical protein NLU13_6753 [Sarocladium strictum]|uniref:Chromo domain-containing protein n=1 Tax=Sarocladium strictum TaxID=5046 RepID=A0AA39GDZ6_SARSR|nr:hypothetical protein NLU13_6753 [Sarocladium strictum]
MASSEVEPATLRAASPTDSLISEIPISDDEWDVEDLLAERVMKGDALGRPAGERCWLVKWTGFDLAEATWEPREHITDELLKRWEEEKKSYLAGTKKPFKVREWKKACIRYWENKIAKQKAVNRKRQREGKKPEPVDCIISARESLNSVDSEDDSDDDINWDELDQNAELRDLNSEASSESLDGSTASNQESSDEELHGASTNRRSLSGDRSLRTDKNRPKTSAPQPAGTTTTKKRKTDHTKGGESHSGKQAALPPRREDQRQETSQIRSSSESTQATSKGLSEPGTVPAKPQSTYATSTSRRANPTSTRDSVRAPARAIKTTRRVGPDAAVNVFVGGARPRTRPTLDQAVEMSSAEPKMLNLRLQNILQKRSRDNEGARDPRLARNVTLSNTGMAIARQPLDFAVEEPSLFVTPDPESRSATSPPSESDPSMGIGIRDAQASMGKTTAPLRSQVGAGGRSSNSSNSNGVDLIGSNTTRRKSVRFECEASLPMNIDIDDGMTVQPDDAPLEVEVSSQSALKDVSKSCKLGSSITRGVEIIFKRLSTHVLTSYLTEFENAGVLNFSHQCSEDDFVLHRTAIQANVVAEGYTKAEAASNTLRRVNERLLSSRRALLCHLNDLCVLLVPNDESNKSRSQGLDLPQTDATEGPAYVIFRPVESFEARILDAFDHSTLGNGSGHSKVNLDIERMLRFTSERLLPASLSAVHCEVLPTFFLLFPLSREDECLLLAKWLRQCNTAYTILTSVVEGHWSFFQTLSSGVVITHRTAAETVRLLPNLGKLLWSPDSITNFSFWTFGIFEQQQLQCESWDHVPECHERPKTLLLKPLLPAGTVFLITPSFLLAQPESAYAFLKWFSQKFVEPRSPTGPACKLAMFADPERWFTELLAQTISTPSSEPADSSSQREEINVRVKTQRLLTKLLSRTDLENEDSLTSALVLAPASIDGNDEQSLVNWFSWWATGHLDMFRRFEVIGTGHSDRFRLTRRVRIPRFQRSSLIDPGAPVDADHVFEQTVQHPIAPPLGLREAARTMQEGLAYLERERLSKMPLAILYRNPVSFFTSDMAFQLRNAGSHLATFDEWFSFFRPLQNISGRRNTYVGLFYTIDGEWCSEAHPADKPSLSRPWFAIFRPQNPNRKPWSSTELFIWDAFLGRRFSDQDEIYESDLIPPQRELISTVAAKNEDKNPQAPLRQVWIGGFESSDPSSNLLQHTLKRLDDLFINFKSDLHARSDLIPRCGWKAVQSGARPAGSLLHSAKQKTQHPRRFTVGESDTEDDRIDRKIIFHPPKGDPRLYSRQVENRLLKEAQRAKDGGEEGEIEFLFATTQQWYGQLIPCKRHSEHVRVAQWATIFNELGLPVRHH